MAVVETNQVLIVGAGLAGLTAAATLADQSVSVVMVDKAKGPGGRLATRRIDAATLDHGAQFFTVRTEAFGQRVEEWVAAGIVEEWCQGFATVDGYPRYRAVGGMNRLAKHLAASLPQTVELHGRQRAEAVIPADECWAITYQGATREPDQSDAVILTPPLPQAVELLRAGGAMPSGPLGERLQAMGADDTYHRVVAILATVDRSPDLPEPGALQRPDHPIFSFVADNQAKGISDAPAVTFHLAHTRSAELWDRTDDEILAEIGDELASTIDPAQPLDIQVKRWRYAGPVDPSPEASLLIADRPGPLILAGDGFAGAKVEGAFTSGLDAATQVLGALRSR